MRRYQETCAGWSRASRATSATTSATHPGLFRLSQGARGRRPARDRGWRSTSSRRSSALNDDLDDPAWSIGVRVGINTGIVVAATSAPASSATAWRWSARPRTSRRACKGSRSRTRSWSASHPPAARWPVSIFDELGPQCIKGYRRAGRGLSGSREATGAPSRFEAAPRAGSRRWSAARRRSGCSRAGSRPEGEGHVVLLPAKPASASRASCEAFREQRAPTSRNRLR